jgi:hypothetical protein
MRRLARAANATLADAKITGYLLDPTHSLQAAAKERFFRSFGFSRANWTDLKQALLEHPTTNPVVTGVTTPYGRKYVVSCSLITPDGRNPCIISVWIIEPPEPEPKFVTTYPGP